MLRTLFGLESPQLTTLVRYRSLKVPKHAFGHLLVRPVVALPQLEA